MASEDESNTNGSSDAMTSPSTLRSKMSSRDPERSAVEGATSWLEMGEEEDLLPSQLTGYVG